MRDVLLKAAIAPDIGRMMGRCHCIERPVPAQLCSSGAVGHSKVINDNGIATRDLA